MESRLASPVDSQSKPTRPSKAFDAGARSQVSGFCGGYPLARPAAAGRSWGPLDALARVLSGDLLRSAHPFWQADGGGAVINLRGAVIPGFARHLRSTGARLQPATPSPSPTFTLAATCSTCQRSSGTR